MRNYATVMCITYWDDPCNEGKDWPYYSITHWMGLPKPPVLDPKEK